MEVGSEPWYETDIEEAVAAVDEASKQDAIVGETNLTEADLTQAVGQLPGVRRAWLLLVLVVGGGVLFLALNSSPIRSQSILAALIPAVFTGLIAIFFRRAANRAWIKQAFASIGGRTTFRFDDYGFSCESSLRQHRLAWASLSRSLDAPQAFLVYPTPGSLLVVPKRAFAEADVVRLRNMLAERITPPPPRGRFAGSAKRILLLWVVLIAMFLAIWHFLDDGAPPTRNDVGRPAGRP